MRQRLGRSVCDQEGLEFAILEIQDSPSAERRLTREAELAMVPSDTVLSIKVTRRLNRGKLTNPDTYEDRESVFLGGSGGEVKSSACAEPVYRDP